MSRIRYRSTERGSGRAARAALTVALLVLPGVAAGAGSFVTFESGQVRPLAMAPGGDTLFVVNTPDNRLEIFTIGAGGLTHSGSVPVGMEPVAVAARTDDEVWVVNHLSDSVSVVDVASSPPRVVRTLLVGDEPRDIVFAGPGGSRAFITTARRGQNLPPGLAPLLTTPSVPRALVFVFDATAVDTSLAGQPLTVIELFGDTPRALAASPDGSTVYAAVFHSGNQTTAVNEGAVCNDSLVDGLPAPPCFLPGGLMPGGLPPPETNFAGVLRPETGLIVKYDPVAVEWRDELGRNWNPAVKFTLPDKDVFQIDADATPPAEIPGGDVRGVGTVIFNMIADPVVPGRLYASNTEARNEVRFEGPGIFGGSTVRGDLHEARITVCDGATVLPRHLNKHLDYSVVPSPPGDSAKSLATPLGMAVTSDGATLYVAAFGSGKIGVLDTSELVANTFTPDAADHIALSAGGPSGLVLDEARGRLYVLTRFDNAISVVDTTLAAEIAHLPLYNPEPPHVVTGRPVLYDALFTSSNGEASCSSCHVFGDLDSLAWDLGNPDDPVLNNPNPFAVPDVLGISFPDHHPMKGPMTTQSLRGMANHGPMHWRGDRTGGNDPGGDPLDEVAAFEKFNVAFEGLLGRSGPIPAPDMTAFANFILDVTYPPNPVRSLDNSLTPDQAAGESFFFSPLPSDVFQNCNGCHVLHTGLEFFGSNGLSSFEFEPQLFKIPHLRNLYQKVGMFGMPTVAFFNFGDNDHKGDQVRGFGFMHDGSVDTLFRFHDSTVFNRSNPGGFPVPNPGGFEAGPAGNVVRRQVVEFMLAFDSNLAPVVGQQVTRTSDNDEGTERRELADSIVIRDVVETRPDRRRIVVRRRGGAITIPAPGSAGDPRCGADPPGTVKAYLTVASQTSGESYQAPLFCHRWRLLGTEASPRGYKYSDTRRQEGSVKNVRWTAGRSIQIGAGASAAFPISYDLQAGVDQGIVDVELVTGADRLCLRCRDFDFVGGPGKVFRGKNSQLECFFPSACPTPTVSSRIELLLARGGSFSECDVVVKGTVAGEARGWRYRRATTDFESDRAGDAPLTAAALRALGDVPGQELTYTCAPPGSGVRMGIDRDEDGFYDRDELDGGSDPADPGSTP
jgi:DNA-binding beta-propeller fold protein YncE